MAKHAQLPDIAWYLIQCKPRQDTRALEHLHRQGFECFFPLINVQKIKTGKLCQVDQPLFPGYVFIHLLADGNWHSLRCTRGVSRVVSFNNQPCRVDDNIIRHIRARCGNELVGRVPKPGDTVQLSVGPSAEVEAIFLALEGEERAILLLNLLSGQRQLKVSLSDIRIA